MSTKIQTAGRIVVGTDGSKRADKAVEWAAERSQALGTALTVLNVIPEVLIPSRTSVISVMTTSDNYIKKYQDDAVQRLDEAVARLKEKYPQVDVESHVVSGNPGQVLSDATKDAFLVVVGARGSGAPMSVRLLGGVSDAVATHSHGPVAVITDEALENPSGPVVVGVDESNEAKVAIDFAFNAADRRGVPLIAIHSWDFGVYDAYSAGMWEHTTDEMIAGLTTMVQEQLAASQEKYPSVEVQIKISRGGPAVALIDESAKAGLVVVGSRGRGGFAGLLLGSTSKHVLREAHCPVVVTRSKETTGAYV